MLCQAKVADVGGDAKVFKNRPIARCRMSQDYGLVSLSVGVFVSPALTSMVKSEESGLVYR